MDFKINKTFINNKEISIVPEKNEQLKIDKVECSNNVKGNWNTSVWRLELDGINKNTECTLYFKTDSKDLETEILTKSGNDVKTNTETKTEETVPNPKTSNMLGMFIGLDVLILLEIALFAYFINKNKNKNVHE